MKFRTLNVTAPTKKNEFVGPKEEDFLPIHTDGENYIKNKTADKLTRSATLLGITTFGKTFSDFQATKDENKIPKNKRIIRREKNRSQGKVHLTEIIQIQNNMMKGLDKSKEKKKIEGMQLVLFDSSFSCRIFLRY